MCMPACMKINIFFTESDKEHIKIMITHFHDESTVPLNSDLVFT
jgi:hypothetical protein